MNRYSNAFTTTVGALILSSLVGCAAQEGDAILMDSGLPAIDASEMVEGGTIFTPSGAWQSIGTIPGCTATLITEYAALTAAHCVDGDADGRTTFTLPNGLGDIDGTIHVHPLYNALHWSSYDYAVVQFDTSIYDDSSVDTTTVTPIPVSKEAAAVGDGTYMFGYGSTGAGCATSGAGYLRYGYGTLDGVVEDWHYINNNDGIGICPGDSGGPLVMYDSGYKIIGVNSFFDTLEGQTISVHKSAYMAYDWIQQHSATPSAPGDTWGHCVLFDTTTDGSYYSFQGNLSSLSGAGWDQTASMVWVKKGYQANLFDYSGYSTSGWTDTLSGFDGENCNEFGCLYDLSGTSMDNDISSIQCESAIPEDTWGDCVLYETYGDGGYLSLQGAHSLDTSYSTWDNRAGQIWVKAGHTAELFADYSYTETVYWDSIVLDGYSGDFCNSYGCLYDLQGTEGERTTSSIDCD